MYKFGCTTLWEIRIVAWRKCLISYKAYDKYPKACTRSMVTTWQIEKNKVPWVKGMKVWKGTSHDSEMQERIKRRNYRKSTINGNMLDVHVS